MTRVFPDMIKKVKAAHMSTLHQHRTPVKDVASAGSGLLTPDQKGPELLFPNHNHRETGKNAMLGVNGNVFDGEFARDAQSFIVQSCERLVAHLGVYNVWIALMKGRAITTLASSFEAGFAPLRERMLTGWCPHCLEQAIKSDEIRLIRDVEDECGDCPLTGKYRGRVGLACRIARGDKVFGVLRVSAPAYMADDDKMHAQLIAAAGHIGDVLFQFYERERMEHELRESRRRLALLMANLPGMAYRCRNDENWTMDFVSEGCIDLTGYPREDLELSRRLSYADLIHPEDRPMVDKAVQTAIQQGESFTIEYRIINAAGEERWVWERGRAVGTGPDGLAELEGFITDITDRLKMQERMQQVKKQESLALMAGGVAHDFNNILSSILGNAEVAMSSVDAGSEPYASLSQIVKSARQAATLCRQMLNFCGRANNKPEPVELSSVIDAMRPLLASILPKNIQVSYDLASTLPVFMAEPNEVRQIILQLVSNAAEAYGERGGKIRISSSKGTFDGRPLNNQMAVPDHPSAGTYVCLGVVDQGCGMDAATKSKMFDPFFSTKFTGRGMGLSSVLGVIQTLGGCILVSSAPGCGTAVKVLFPVAETEAGVAPAPPPARVPVPAKARIKTVLLADDEPSLIALCEKMLEREKCTTLVAHDGAEAVDLYRQHRDKIDLVILDLTMPELNGIEAFEQIRAINPSARVAFATGYSVDDISSRVDPATLAGILLKPFSRTELRALLMRAARM